jgi:hypothetical protein
MSIENDEIREKLLCVLRNNIQDLKSVDNRSYLEIGDVRIYCYTTFVYKDVVIKKEVIEEPQYFWHKPKVKFVDGTGIKIDYTTFDVTYGNYTTRLTKEEYEEIMKIREEKIKEKQLEELTKLCNTTN